MIAEMGTMNFSFTTRSEYYTNVIDFVEAYPAGGEIIIKSDDGKELLKLDVGPGKNHGEETRKFFKQNGI
jgi:hypothetical protein